MSRVVKSFDELVYVAERVGVKVIAAKSSRNKGAMGNVYGPVIHHTGTSPAYRPTQDYPTYSVVKEGRTGLENSLSAFGLGRFEAIYVFNQQISWHAGGGLWRGLTDGNGHLWGIEAESDGSYWTPWQVDVYPRLVASILDYVGETSAWAPLHGQWARPLGRKTDAKNLPRDFFAQVDRYVADPRTINRVRAGVVPVLAKIEENDMIVQVPQGKTGVLATHRTAAPADWFVNVVSNTSGGTVYGKQVFADGSAVGLFVDTHPQEEWELWVAPGNNIEVKLRPGVTRVEILNRDAEGEDVAAVLTPIAKASPDPR